MSDANVAANTAAGPNQARSTAPGGAKVSKGLLDGIRFLGVGLLFATAGIHLDLYLTGYKFLPTIGKLFLVQVVVGAILAIVVAVFRSRLVALAGGVFALGTLAGYELFRATTIFNFHEVAPTSNNASGFTAGIIEAVAFAALAAYATLLPVSDKEGAKTGPLAQLGPAMNKRSSIGVAGAVSIVLLVLVGVTSIPKSASTTNAGPPTSSGSGVSVVIQNFAFHPADLTVTPGETITVTNKDGVGHTFTSKPPGAFDSGVISPGQTVTVKAPTKPGKYPYECTIHTYMLGVLTVS